jgi:hypothetical protein
MESKETKSKERAKMCRPFVILTLLIIFHITHSAVPDLVDGLGRVQQLGVPKAAFEILYPEVNVRKSGNSKPIYDLACDGLAFLQRLSSFILLVTFCLIIDNVECVHLFAIGGMQDADEDAININQQNPAIPVLLEKVHI